ncbi:hypothetical protein Q8A67_025275 [Cirrhinus molitorella]|uniref:Uncharacterized protein n=1 Tax=Cirrhinus molitorella TaxID=172907 RepID=A0AA88NZG2_9TELE|nr:hypothetical protein Q8A67_025275 [Cirrhinus molitorella]
MVPEGAQEHQRTYQHTTVMVAHVPERGPSSEPTQLHRPFTVYLPRSLSGPAEDQGQAALWEQELVSVDRSQLSSHHHHSPSVCVPLPLLVRSVPDSLRKAGRFALSAVSVGLSFSGVFPPWFLSSKITFSCIWSQRMTHIWESGPKAEVEAA